MPVRKKAKGGGTEYTERISAYFTPEQKERLDKYAQKKLYQESMDSPTMRRIILAHIESEGF